MNAIYEQIGGTYRWDGDYLIPDLTLPEQPRAGTWGRRYLRYLKEQHPVVYSVMLLNETLSAHVAEIDRQAVEMLDRLIQQMARQEDVTEQLKAVDPMEWVRRMNGIRARAEGMIIADIFLG